jgi:hypothetical protein
LDYKNRLQRRAIPSGKSEFFNAEKLFAKADTSDVDLLFRSAAVKGKANIDMLLL